jgi:hypothetical protein
MAQGSGRDAERNPRLVITALVNKLPQPFVAPIPYVVWRPTRPTRPRDRRARSDPKGWPAAAIR